MSVAADVRPPRPIACATCPWRLSNQGDVERPAGALEGEGLRFYEERGRRELWWERTPGGVGGSIIACHQQDPTQGHEPVECAGAWSLQCRALLRRLEGGADHALTEEGAQTVLLRLGAGPALMRMPAALLAGWVVTHVHPGVLDADVASEAVPAPTPAELERWTPAA
jgi:hypothetical protein